MKFIYPVVCIFYFIDWMTGWIIIFHLYSWFYFLFYSFIVDGQLDSLTLCLFFSFLFNLFVFKFWHQGFQSSKWYDSCRKQISMISSTNVSLPYTIILELHHHSTPIHNYVSDSIDNGHLLFPTIFPSILHMRVHFSFDIIIQIYKYIYECT